MTSELALVDALVQEYLLYRGFNDVGDLHPNGKGEGVVNQEAGRSSISCHALHLPSGFSSSLLLSCHIFLGNTSFGLLM